jgi:hypothetical protein
MGIFIFNDIFSLYCDACQTLETNKGLKAELLLDGKPINCGEGLKPGSYENLELAFCMPNADEMLKNQGLTRETFKNLIQSEVKIKRISMGKMIIMI